MINKYLEYLVMAGITFGVVYVIRLFMLNAGG